MSIFETSTYWQFPRFFITVDIVKLMRVLWPMSERLQKIWKATGTIRWNEVFTTRAFYVLFYVDKCRLKWCLFIDDYFFAHNVITAEPFTRRCSFERLDLPNRGCPSRCARKRFVAITVMGGGIWRQKPRRQPSCGGDGNAISRGRSSG